MDISKQVPVSEYLSNLSKDDRKAVKNLNDKKDTQFIPTGSWVIDRLIGDGTGELKSGGLPRGHVVEVFGDESCGKTTLGLSACVETQRLGLTPVWLDYERTFSKDYAKKLGLDLHPNKFIFQEPDSFEHGVKLLGDVLRIHPALIVVDSVSAMVPAAFLDFASDDPTRIGEQARLMSKFLGAMGKYISEYKTCLLFLNQLRSVIKGQYDRGPKEETSGGRAMKYYSSVRIEMWKKEVDYVEEISRITGKKEKRPNNIKVKVTIKKNKVDKPYYSGPIYLRFGEGFDNITSIIDLASTCNVIKKSGAFFRFDSEGQTLFNVSGRENLRNFLEQNQKILQTLSSCVKLKVDEEAKAEGLKDIDEDEGLVNTMDIDNILSDVKEKLDAPQEQTPAEPSVKKARKNAKG